MVDETINDDLLKDYHEKRDNLFGRSIKKKVDKTLIDTIKADKEKQKQTGEIIRK